MFLPHQLKRYTVNGLFALAACVLMYRDLATSESSAPEVAFRIVPQYVQILITLLAGTTRQIVMHRHTSGDGKTYDVSSGRRQTVLFTLDVAGQTLSGWSYWVLTSMCLVSSNWLRLSNRDRSAVNPETILQVYHNIGW